jgi:hypothetical protein
MIPDAIIAADKPSAAWPPDENSHVTDFSKEKLDIRNGPL